MHSKINSPDDPTSYLQINIGSLRRNIDKLKSVLHGETSIVAVVKSDAYGLGLLAAARQFEEAGVYAIAVASAEEVVDLRKGGITAKLIVLYPPKISQLETLIENDAELTVTTLDLIEAINDVAAKKNRLARVHLQVETGMNYYGANQASAHQIIKAAQGCDAVKIIGISTHFAGAEPQVVVPQLKAFKAILGDIVKKSSFQPEVIHCASSATLDLFPDTYEPESFHELFPGAKTCVRVGAILYGLYTPTNPILQMEKPIMSFVSHISEIKHLSKNDRVGYFGGASLTRDSVIGIVPVGWGMGYYPKEGHVRIGDEYAPLIGPIAANNCAVDLTDLSDCRLYQRITLFTTEEDEIIGLDAVANRHDMFVNRFISQLGAANKKQYVNEA